MGRKTVLIIATLDTKGEEVGYLKGEIEKRGKAVLVLDSGTGGEPRGTTRDVTREEVAEAAGTSYRAISEMERNDAEEVMARGVASIVRRLYQDGKFDGVIGIGGSDGTLLASAGMRQLPIGVPKLIVSAMACGNTRFGDYVGTKDITIMPSVVDVVGTSPISRGIFENAAGAICGMVDSEVQIRLAGQGFIALTMFGQTTPCGTRGRELIENEDYQVITFHPNGTGGAVMEELIQEGAFSGVWDLTTQELSEEVVSGRPLLGPERLSGISETHEIPRLVVPGCVDFIWGSPEDERRFRGRRTYQFNRLVMLGKLTESEITKVAGLMAERLTRPGRCVAVVLPLRGISMYDKEGQPLYDPDLDALFFARLRDRLDSKVRLVEIDAHINDPKFAEACVSMLMQMVRGAEGRLRAEHRQAC